MFSVYSNTKGWFEGDDKRGGKREKEKRGNGKTKKKKMQRWVMKTFELTLALLKIWFALFLYFPFPALCETGK